MNIVMTEKEKKDIFSYPEDLNIKQPEDDIIITQGSQSEQATKSSGWAKNQQNTTSDSNSSSTQKTTFTGSNPYLSSSRTINADNDSVLKNIGSMRQERLNSLKSNLQKSADRERRKLRFNAWSDFLSSLGNIAGVGNNVVVRPDNTKTLESFKRMQDIYDAADNLHNNPTLTWLDRERLNRQAAIDAYNLQAAQNDINVRNQWELNKANRTAFETTSSNRAHQDSASNSRSDSGQTGYSKSVTKQGMTPIGISVKNNSGKGSGEYAVMIGGGRGTPAANLKGLTKAEALFMVTDVLEARKNGGKSSTTGKDVGGLLSGKIEYEYKGDKKEYDLGSSNDIDVLMATILGNSGESQVAINTLASKFDKKDKDGVYYNYFTGNDYGVNLDDM